MKIYSLIAIVNGELKSQGIYEDKNKAVKAFVAIMLSGSEQLFDCFKKLNRDMDEITEKVISELTDSETDALSPHKLKSLQLIHENKSIYESISFKVEGRLGLKGDIVDFDFYLNDADKVDIYLRTYELDGE